MPFALDRYRGIFPAALTMFDKDNNLDEDATGRHWEWLITQQGVDGLVIAGTSGEFIAMDMEERIRVQAGKGCGSSTSTGNFWLWTLQHKTYNQALGRG